jgi:hypothetical protein
MKAGSYSMKPWRGAASLTSVWLPIVKRLKEAEEIRASVPDEAEEVLARERTTAREILAWAHTKATEITSAVCHRIPLTVGPPNPALAGEEARREAQHLMNQARANAASLLSNTR